MSDIYSAIVEEFKSELSSLRELLSVGQNRALRPSARVASVRASTLLLASTFEEFVREMAREYAAHVVCQATSLDDIPDKLVEAAWHQTLDHIVHIRIRGESKKSSLALAAKECRPKFDAACSFVEGDISQNVFEHLTRNKNNMRPDEINKLFRIGGISNVCMEVCKGKELQRFFGQRGPTGTHAALHTKLNGFIDKRNSIAHTPNLMSSESPDEALKDMHMLSSFSSDLKVALSAL